jgi:hypothetical protein
MERERVRWTRFANDAAGQCPARLADKLAGWSDADATELAAVGLGLGQVQGEWPTHVPRRIRRLLLDAYAAWTSSDAWLSLRPACAHHAALHFKDEEVEEDDADSAFGRPCPECVENREAGVTAEQFLAAYVLGRAAWRGHRPALALLLRAAAIEVWTMRGPVLALVRQWCRSVAVGVGKTVSLDILDVMGVAVNRLDDCAASDVHTRTCLRACASRVAQANTEPVYRVVALGLLVELRELRLDEKTEDDTHAATAAAAATDDAPERFLARHREENQDLFAAMEDLVREALAVEQGAAPASVARAWSTGANLPSLLTRLLRRVLHPAEGCDVPRSSLLTLAQQWPAFREARAQETSLVSPHAGASDQWLNVFSRQARRVQEAGSDAFVLLRRLDSWMHVPPSQVPSAEQVDGWEQALAISPAVRALQQVAEMDVYSLAAFYRTWSAIGQRWTPEDWFLVEEMHALTQQGLPRGTSPFVPTALTAPATWSLVVTPSRRSASLPHLLGDCAEVIRAAHDGAHTATLVPLARAARRDLETLWAWQWRCWALQAPIFSLPVQRVRRVMRLTSDQPAYGEAVHTMAAFDLPTWIHTMRGVEARLVAASALDPAPASMLACKPSVRTTTYCVHHP